MYIQYIYYIGDSNNASKLWIRECRRLSLKTIKIIITVTSKSKHTHKHTHLHIKYFQYKTHTKPRSRKYRFVRVRAFLYTARRTFTYNTNLGTKSSLIRQYVLCSCRITGATVTVRIFTDRKFYVDRVSCARVSWVNNFIF